MNGYHGCRDKELSSRNRTISEPVDGSVKAGHVTPEPGTTPRPRSVRYSPGILSPTSPGGSVSAGLDFFSYLLTFFSVINTSRSGRRLPS